MDSSLAGSVYCGGIYSANDKPGPNGNSTININVPKFDFNVRPNDYISLAIFEYNDWIGSFYEHSIVHYDLDKFVCNEYTIAQGKCNMEDEGTFIFPRGSLESAKNQIINQKVPLGDEVNIEYVVKNTGFYCVVTSASSSDIPYWVVVDIISAFGGLLASEIHLINNYFIMIMIYAAFSIGWLHNYFKHRHDIFELQRYILYLLIAFNIKYVLLLADVKFQNHYGQTVSTTIFAMAVNIFASFVQTFSLLILAFVCHGYGILTLDIGVKKELRSKLWALAYFVSQMTASISVRYNQNTLMIISSVLILVITTGFYIFIAMGLKKTRKELADRKQNYKSTLYLNLHRVVLYSLMTYFLVMVVYFAIYMSKSSENIIVSGWKGAWIVDLVGRFLFFINVSLIAYILRPTSKSRQFAMSLEPITEEDGLHVFNYPVDNYDSNEEDNFEIGEEDAHHEQRTWSSRPITGQENVHHHVEPEEFGEFVESKDIH
ncbi:hypothetical protein NADFUDRAFT_45689 [Nadsonia fulvescens var. elongata DSM 6958]|uniref:Uncharacterized protein n=1 Tax=Nadsonia fulvescens var. elongata DSM 6958 TaxID=857566 RepID=A0A1E3PQC1_9ASCO|nr:hypothetical protein NADFUDRAFT_45689 [Nadsonia fulvescens var. elongata DSM 6958]